MTLSKSENPQDRAQDRIDIGVLILCVLTLLVIPLTIAGMGYLPSDDALRHSAKAVSGKPWSDILVLRHAAAIDHHIGWHTTLGLIHRFTGVGTDGLVFFSIVSMFALYSCSGLFFVHRSESWLLALLTLLTLSPYIVTRLMYGRPMFASQGALIVLLWLWSARPEAPPNRRTIFGTFCLLTMVIWIHGSWYLFALPVGAFILARRWRAAGALGACWIAASVSAACLTGHPWCYLWQQIEIPIVAFSNYVPARHLVLELRPFDGVQPAMAVVAFMILWRHARTGKWPELFRDPVFLLVAVGWALGFRVLRFWCDWGMPALLVWMAKEYDSALCDVMPAHFRRRLVLTAAACGVLYLATTGDYNNRWTKGLDRNQLIANHTQPLDWHPDPGGILYNNSMTVFYDTFYANPNGDWKYILGFEPVLMPTEDLKTYRNLQMQKYAFDAYQPWVDKMRPIDRMILESTSRPEIPELKWANPYVNIWVGQLKDQSGSR